MVLSLVCPTIESECPTAVSSFKFEFFKFLFAESICLKLSFPLHVVAWLSDNGKYVRLKTRVRRKVRVQGVRSVSSPAVQSLLSLAVKLI